MPEVIDIRAAVFSFCDDPYLGRYFTRKDTRDIEAIGTIMPTLIDAALNAWRIFELTGEWVPVERIGSPLEHNRPYRLVMPE
jgi:hypothetical protein